MKLLKNQKGMTLVELLAVLVILGIIAAIAIPMIGNVISNSKDKAILADAQSILSAAKLAQANGDVTGDGTLTFGDEILQKYLDGIDLADEDQVTYTPPTTTTSNGTTTKTDGKWEVTYSKLSDLNNSKYSTIKENGKIDSVTLSGYLKSN